MIERYRLSRTVTAAADMALITLDQAKTTLGLDPTDTSQDAKITAQIAQVSNAVNRYCDHIIPQQSYRDQFRYVCNYTWPGEPLPLRQFPLAVDDTGAAIAAVTENGAVLDPASYEADIEAGTLYRLDSTGIYGWTGSLIIVDYTAGYQPIPDDVQAAALDWLAARWYGEGRDPALRRESVPDVLMLSYENSNPNDSGLSPPPTARDLLAPYRMWSV